VGWSETARDHLCQVKDWPDHESPDGYRDAIEQGRIFALGVFCDDEQIGTTFFKYDVGDQGKELVILASAGRLPGGDLVAMVLPFMEQLAKSEGCLSVAFFTSRTGLIKKTAMHGYKIAQTIMRKGF